MIPEGYLVRHAGGRAGGRDVALLDVAQDYALRMLADEGLFDLGLVFKGGTALRKCRAGNEGRFSTDLDFCGTERPEELFEMAFEALDARTLHDVAFTVTPTGPRRADLTVRTPLGTPAVPAKIEISSRPPWLPVEHLKYIDLPVHKPYEFVRPVLPVLADHETIAEKLAAWRRRAKARDLYDLAWFGRRPFDEPLVRQLTVLKVFLDVVEDDLGERPFDPAEITAARDLGPLEAEDIGLLTQPVDVPAWLAQVRHRYQFMTALTEDEQGWVRCNPADKYQVHQAIAAL